MTTRHEPAFPLPFHVDGSYINTFEGAMGTSRCNGLTKLEYAAIQIAAGGTGARVAIDEANAIFDLLEKENG